MQVLMLGATALASVFLAFGAASLPAYAQTPPAPVQLTKQMVGPMNEARTAIIAKDWATAKTKLTAAATQAKTPQDKLALERLRLAMAAAIPDYPQQIISMEAMIASGLMTAEEVKQYKGALAKAHLDNGDTAKSLVAFRVYIDEYGGTPEQFASIANDSAKANDNATALIYITKAIDALKAKGTKPPESYYRLQMRIYQQSNDMPNYYKTEELAVADYPKEAYWKELIARVQKEPGYGGPVRLDMFRALVSAGVKLTPQEKSTAAEEALRRGLPNEALSFLETAVAAGELGSVAQGEDNLKKAQEQVAKDKAGLAAETKDALAKGTSSTLAAIGEAQLSYGDNAKAVELLQAALTKGIAAPAEADITRIHLGIAQHRSGQKDAARATWAEVKADASAIVLAHNWTLISKLIP